jgi:hypothetical protein
VHHSELSDGSPGHRLVCGGTEPLVGALGSTLGIEAVPVAVAVVADGSGRLPPSGCFAHTTQSVVASTLITQTKWGAGT